MPVMALMVIVPGMMAGVMGASVTPFAVVRPCRSRRHDGEKRQ